MAVDAKLMTAEELLLLEPDGLDYELLDGVPISMPPPGQRHGRLVNRIGKLVSAEVEPSDRGYVVTGSGILIQRSPDTVLAPDVAVYLGPALPAIDEPENYTSELPAVVFEIVSPSDRADHINAKIEKYLMAGGPMVVEVSPRTRLCTVHTIDRRAIKLSDHDAIDHSHAAPEFRLAVRAIFA